MMWLSYCTLKGSYRYRLVDRAHRQRVRFFVSEYILNELGTVLVEDLGRDRRFAVLARRAILRIAQLVTLPPSIKPHVPGDPHDDPIVQTGLSAKADYLITADNVLLALGKVEDLVILSASQFEEKLAPEE
jgi:putative PIN family toxin of toxin-antitoxin system